MLVGICQTFLGDFRQTTVWNMLVFVQADKMILDCFYSVAIGVLRGAIDFLLAKIMYWFSTYFCQILLSWSNQLWFYSASNFFSLSMKTYRC